MLKNLNNIKFKIVMIGLFLSFGFFDIIKFSVFDGGIDSGYFLSTARDWVKLGRVPNFDTYNAYTPLGVMIYAVPFLIVDSPDIISFLLLNLCIYLVSFILFVRIADLLFGKSFWTLVLSLSFLYNTHEIVNDIKLENLALVFGLLIVNVFTNLIYSKDKENDKSWGVKAIIIGCLCALSFLTKQYGGLSLIFSVLIVFVLFYERRIKLIATIMVSFSCILLVYFLLQFIGGLSFQTIYIQLKGEINLQCNGSIYGQKNIINLLKGLKYYKFDGIVFCGIFILIYHVKKRIVQNTKKIHSVHVYKKMVLFIFVFIIALVPFYFQIYPHYKFFGIPFIYFTSMLLLNEVIGVSANFNLSSVAKLIGIFTACLFIYSSASWFQLYKSLELKKELSLDLEKNINSKLKKGTLVHCLQNRKLWFKCEFVSPFPRTIGYAYLQLNCLEKALHFEKPKSFWVIGGLDLPRETLANYSVIERHDFDDGNKKYIAVHFERDIGKYWLNKNNNK
jgi:hypothetical protein